MEWLLSHNCRPNQQTSSFGSLEGTNIHFSQSILPVDPFGYMMSGQYTLSPDQKRITATVGGECASIYFGRDKTYANGLLPFVTHEVPVWFDNIGKTSSFFGTGNIHCTCIFRAKMESTIQSWPRICVQALM